MEEDKELEALNKMVSLIREYIKIEPSWEEKWDFWWDFSEGNDIEYLIKKLKEILKEVK